MAGRLSDTPSNLILEGLIYQSIDDNPLTLEYVPWWSYRPGFSREIMSLLKNNPTYIFSSELVDEVLQKGYTSLYYNLFYLFPQQFGSQDQFIQFIAGLVKRMEKLAEQENQYINDFLAKELLLTIDTAPDTEILIEALIETPQFFELTSSFVDDRALEIRINELHTKYSNGEISERVFELFEIYFLAVPIANNRVSIVQEHPEDFSLQFYQDLINLYIDYPVLSKTLSENKDFLQLLYRIDFLEEKIDSLLIESPDLLFKNLIELMLADSDQHPRLVQLLKKLINLPASEKHVKYSHFYLALLSILNLVPLTEIDTMRHLLESGTVFDAVRVRSRYFQEKFLQEKFSRESPDINLDTESMLYLMQQVKECRSKK